MDYTRLILKKEWHIATVTFNRPDVGNAFDFKLMEEFDHMLRKLDEDKDVRTDPSVISFMIAAGY